ncbi:MAG: iron chelate uptake ABC transporter family permease subunit, partial [Anaerolineae bacterium]|nr:iron chelate uptake ABC transporter family permease subunit [Anaerolineae bacterium]
DWKFVYALLPWIVVLIPLTLYKAQTLNIMNLGDATATGLGVHVFSQRNLLLLTAVALAGASVAVRGGIGFLGLIGPHLGRRLVGPNHRVLLPVSFLIGSILLVLADIVARQLIPPLEIPVGIVVAAIGAPYFLYLLVRSNT